MRPTPRTTGMAQQPRRAGSTLAAASLFMLCALLAAATSTARADSVQRVYDTIREQEELLNAPQFPGRAAVGTFDLQTGKFSGLRSSTHCRPGNSKPTCTTIAPTLDVFGVRAVLVFRFRHVALNGQVKLQVGGRTRMIPKNRKRVAVDVGRTTRATWSITAKQGNTITAEIADAVRIHRPPVLGAGVFTLKAVPVAIVYTPPQPADPSRFNSTQYTEAKTLGTRISTSFGSEKGRERPLRTTFETVKLLQTGMAAAADGMKGSENPKVKAAGTAIGLIGRRLAAPRNPNKP